MDLLQTSFVVDTTSSSHKGEAATVNEGARAAGVALFKTNDAILLSVIQLQDLFRYSNDNNHPHELSMI